jgi:Phosphotransferase enzyme family
VRLILCSGAGAVLGALPEFAVESPWWPDVEPVVEAARDRVDVDVIVLRLLSTTTESPAMGGEVSYLAEVLGDPPAGLEACGEDAAGEDEPLRAPWARPGGIAATIDWADETLATLGRPRTGPARQIKSWNLSSILRLPTAGGDVWCKSVPPFQDHEGVVLGIVSADDPTLVPPLLAADRASGTVLLDDVPGDDQWAAPEPVLREMVRRWVRTQSRWAARVNELAAAGLPDWRAVSFPGLVSAMLERDEVRAGLGAEELEVLDMLAADLPRRLSAIADCGLPETIVHGDFHPGNWRSDGTSLVLLDWGDSGIGHPLLDHTAFLPRVPEEIRGPVAATWAEAWRAERPGTDPSRAAKLIAPVAALRQALIYRVFLDGIEPSERRYHESDVPFWLRRAIEGASPSAT